MCRAHCTRAPLTVYARTARAVHAQRIRVHVAPARYIYARTVRTHRARRPHTVRTCKNGGIFFDFGGVVLKLVVFLKIGGVFFPRGQCSEYKAHTARSVRAHCTHASAHVQCARTHCTCTPRAPTAHRTRFQNW